MKRIIFIILTPLILITLLLSSVEFALKPWLNQFVKMKINQFVMINLSSITDNILQATGIKIAGILGTPAIKELGMVIDLRRGIVTLKPE